jgi:hypothetical protein
MANDIPYRTTEEDYKHALRRIIAIGANNTDLELVTRTGTPHEATHRGLMYVAARNVARKALLNAHPYQLTSEDYSPQAESLFCVVAVGRMGGHHRETHIGDFTREECIAYAKRMNETRVFVTPDGSFALTYKVAEYKCVPVESEAV